MKDRWTRGEFQSFFDNGSTDKLVAQKLGISVSSVRRLRKYHEIDKNTAPHNKGRKHPTTPEEKELLKTFIAIIIFAKKQDKEFNVLDCAGAVRSGLIKPTDIRVM